MIILYAHTIVPMLSKQPAKKSGVPRHSNGRLGIIPATTTAEPSTSLDPERAFCVVCSDIWKTGSNNTGSAQAAEADVCAAAEKGCPTCSLISKATTIFYSHYIHDESESECTLKVDAITILQDKGHLSLRLFFQKLDGMWGEVFLDLFSPRSMLSILFYYSIY